VAVWGVWGVLVVGVVTARTAGPDCFQWLCWLYSAVVCSWLPAVPSRAMLFLHLSRSICHVESILRV
jgi:hypothetical protein